MDNSAIYLSGIVIYVLFIIYDLLKEMISSLKQRDLKWSTASNWDFTCRN